MHAGYPTDVAGILLCESDGTHEEVADEVRRVEAIMEASGATLIRVSQLGRRAPEVLGRAQSRVSRRSAASRPITTAWTARSRASASPKCCARSPSSRRKYGLRCANVFHAGDGNLHPLILYDANKPGELERTEAFGAEILELSIAVGGTITGEHGVGIEKVNHMCVQFRTPSSRCSTR